MDAHERRKGAPVQDEEKLYGPIEDLMRKRGYAVIPQFKTFSFLTRRARRLDVLGFRWTEDGDVDAWAVEAKAGELPADALAALGQSIEHQLYVPHVSVAAEVPREALEFAEAPIREMGLGYIHATELVAAEIVAATASPRFYQDEFNHVIRHAGVLCLLGRKRWMEEVSASTILPEVKRAMREGFQPTASITRTRSNTC
jgi:hypothetical protein